MSLFRRGFGKGSNAEDTTDAPPAYGGAEISDGSLKYVVEKGGNGSEESYQEAHGAPVEANSPLGYSVGNLTIIFLNFSKMVGTGVYSTPSTILSGTGSIGLSLIYWVIGLLTALSSFSVYLEFAAYFPNRSGSEVVYLEQAFPRPAYFFPTTFAVQSVLLSFSSSNAIVCANYLYAMSGSTPSAWEQKGVAFGVYSVAFLFVVFHTRSSYLVSNAIGAVKLLTLIFVAITGLVVLGGHTRVKDPKANFRNSFEGKATPYGLTNALVKIVFAYAGYENAFNVVNEVKNPVKKIRNSGFGALFITAILYILANIAYFAAVPAAEIKKANQITASLFFQHVFGSSGTVRGLNFLIAISAFGNLVAVLLGSSRLIRECGRQGVLPFPRFWASTKPFGTPIGPYFVKWFLTIIMILAPPAGDAFNFVVDLANYPSSAFNFVMAIGIYMVRYRRKRLGLPRPSFRAWDPVIWFNILVNLYLLVMPWYPPTKGRNGGDVSFWYATYVVTGIAILVTCGLYYVAWIYIIPRWRKYSIRQEVVTLDGGASAHRLVKVPLSALTDWDASHDALGRRLDQRNSDSGSGENLNVTTDKAA